MEYERDDNTEMENEEPSEETALADPATQAYIEPVQHAPQYSMLMRTPSPVLITVVDEFGYLVPVWSAADLLRICKSYWRASQG